MSLKETADIYRKMHRKAVEKGDLERVVRETDDIAGSIAARLFRDRDNSDDHSQAFTSLAAASIVEQEIIEELDNKKKK